MGHQIYNGNAYSRRNAPMWHKINAHEEYGLEAEQDYTATTLVEDVFDLPVITQQKLQLPAIGADGLALLDTLGQPVMTDSKYSVIVRSPHGNTHVAQEWGIVTDQYHRLTYSDGAAIWDEATNKLPVETLGILTKGRIMFITAELSEFDVKRDGVSDNGKHYLYFNNPVDGQRAASVGVTSVRIVCYNTLMAALRGAQASHRILHRDGVEAELTHWLSDYTKTTKQITAEIETAFNAMANTDIDDVYVNWIAGTIYPAPPPVAVKPFWDEEKVAKKHAEHERLMDKAHALQHEVVRLFGGEGIGADLKTADGTAYGLYNAISQIEDNRASRAGSDVSAMMLPTGDRQQNVRKAFEFCQKLTYAGAFKSELQPAPESILIR